MGKRIFILVVSGYRTYLSPFLPRSCRFFPTCSAYAEQAVERRGLRSGLRLTLRRLLHCHSSHPGGYDPVP